MGVDVALLCTDLDGTLIGSANELPLYSDFADRVDVMRRESGTVWSACTGRTFSSFWEFFLPMRRMGILPDYVIIRHAFIYRFTRFGFLPHLWWNITILVRLWREGLAASDAIDKWHETLTGGALGVSTIRRENHRLSLRFDSDESANVAADLLRQKTLPFRHLKVFVQGRDVDVRSIPATKGMAVSELARHLGISPVHILSVGNGHNDLSMLDPGVSGMAGCPANSEDDVIEAIHRSNGHVASHRSLMGVMEILDAYAEGAVCSDLPRNFRAMQEEAKIRPSRRSKGMARRGRPHTHPLLFVGMAYAGLLVFASFDVLPFSHLIRKPLDLLVELSVKLFAGL